MARQEIDLGTRPTGVGGDTPRSAMVKINAMTAELYDGRITNTTLLNAGLANDSQQKGSTGNANNQPAGTNWSYNGIDSNAAANNWPVLGVPSADVWWNITTTGLAGNRATQVAVQVYNGAFVGVMYVRTKQDATWFHWKKVIESGDYGFGPGGPPYNGNIDNLRSPDLISGQGPGGSAFYRLTGATTGTFPSGLNGGLLQIVAWDINTVAQLLYFGDHQYTRNSLGGTAWNDWVRVFSNRNATATVVGGINSGLMDTVMMGNWRVMKYLNGMLVAMGSDLPNTAVIGVNQGAFTDVQLPFSIADYGRASANISFQATQSWDIYGISTQYFSAPDKITYLIRNGGAVAQSFGAVRITVIGTWR